MEALSRSFKGRWTGARVEEVSTMAVGEFGEKESDNLT